jgi:hypothetical protein
VVGMGIGEELRCEFIFVAFAGWNFGLGCMISGCTGRRFGGLGFEASSIHSQGN